MAKEVAGGHWGIQDVGEGVPSSVPWKHARVRPGHSQSAHTRKIKSRKTEGAYHGASWALAVWNQQAVQVDTVE